MATVLSKTDQRAADSMKSRNLAVANLIPIGSHQQDTSISSATTITISDTATRYILVQNSDPSVTIRYTIDGSTTPTASLGFRLQPYGLFIVNAAYMTFTCIEESAGGQVDWQECA